MLRISLRLFCRLYLDFYHIFSGRYEELISTLEPVVAMETSEATMTRVDKGKAKATESDLSDASTEEMIVTHFVSASNAEAGPGPRTMVILEAKLKMILDEHDSNAAVKVEEAHDIKTIVLDGMLV